MIIAEIMGNYPQDEEQASDRILEETDSEAKDSGESGGLLR